MDLWQIADSTHRILNYPIFKNLNVMNRQQRFYYECLGNALAVNDVNFSPSRITGRIKLLTDGYTQKTKWTRAIAKLMWEQRQNGSYEKTVKTNQVVAYAFQLTVFSDHRLIQYKSSSPKKLSYAYNSWHKLNKGSEDRKSYSWRTGTLFKTHLLEMFSPVNFYWNIQNIDFQKLRQVQTTRFPPQAEFSIWRRLALFWLTVPTTYGDHLTTGAEREVNRVLSWGN